MPEVRSKLVTAAAVGAAALGGAAIASAASSGSDQSAATAPTASYAAQGGDRDHGRHSVNGRTEQALSGSVEANVRKAALAKVPGTVERVETNVDSSAPYEAHIVKSDGAEVEVQVNKDFKVFAVNEMGGRHP